MTSEDWTRTFRDIIDDARHRLAHRSETTNLYLETVPCAKGSVIGPGFPKIRAPRRSYLVFADDDPMANFGHRCRYLFYDEKTHAYRDEVDAQFPPYLYSVPHTYKVIHRPVRPLDRVLRAREITPAPNPPPDPAAVPRKRYAILFSGSADRWHLNDLEYCYRMLTEQYGFDPANICVLNRNNTRKLKDGTVAMNWPEESDQPNAYRIPVPPLPASAPAPLLSASADQTGFQQACAAIKQKNLQPEDLVFIHINGHGGVFDINGQLISPWLVGHDGVPYFVDKFCADLAALPSHESLLIVMQQCYSGQFIGPVINAKGTAQNQIKATRLSIACASLDPSYSNEECTFNKFMFGWLTAHLAADPFGKPPSKPVDGGAGAPANGMIEASEAFTYAASVGVAHPNDLPACKDVPAVPTVAMGESIPAAGDIRLVS